jgi:hypothetical protein
MPRLHPRSRRLLGLLPLHGRLLSRRHVHVSDHAPTCRIQGEAPDGHADARYRGTGCGENGTGPHEPGVDSDRPMRMLVVLAHDSTIQRQQPTRILSDGSGRRTRVRNAQKAVGTPRVGPPFQGRRFTESIAQRDQSSSPRDESVEEQAMKPGPSPAFDPSAKRT